MLTILTYMRPCSSFANDNITTTDVPISDVPVLTTSITTQSNKIPQVNMQSRLQEDKTSLNSIKETEKNETNKETKGLFGGYEFDEKTKEPVPCTCGVFLSGQFKKGSKDQPKGVPVLTQETDTPFMNNAMGSRQCTNKCLELVRIFHIFLII